MKPLPKPVGVIGAIGAVVAAVVTAVQDPALAPLIPAKVSALVISLGSILSVLSHSLTGNGGKEG